MKKSALLALSLVVSLFTGAVFAQGVPQNYVAAGFNLGSGVSAWTSTAGPNGFGFMNFNPSGAPLIDSYARNDYGTVSVLARPWANGFVQSGNGGSGTISSTFMGGSSAGVHRTDQNGVNTFTSISKSLTLSADSSGNGSASVSGGFDVSVTANGFAPPAFVFVPVPMPMIPRAAPGMIIPAAR